MSHCKWGVMEIAKKLINIFKNYYFNLSKIYLHVKFAKCIMYS